MKTLDDLVTKISGWIDQLFGYFGFYSGKYSKLLVYILAAFVVGKYLFKGKLDVKVGGKS